jgi:ferredoxin
VQELLARLPHAHRFVCFTAPQTGDAQAGTFDVEGRLTAQRLDELGLPVDGDYYLCGPDAFMDDISAALVARGVAPERLRTERFGAVDVTASGVVATKRRPPHPPDGPPGSGPMVSFARSGLSVPWSPEHRNLLELSEACDVPANFGCRTGVCHTCQASVLSGHVRYEPEPLDRPARDTALLCCSAPEGDVILDL